MSKSKPKAVSRNSWYEDNNDYYYIDRQELNERRRSKKMKNFIRSKNIGGLLEIDNDELEWDHK